MKIEIEIIKGFCWGDEVIKIVKSNGESLHIFNEEAISFFTSDEQFFLLYAVRPSDFLQ